MLSAVGLQQKCHLKRPSSTWTPYQPTDNTSPSITQQTTWIYEHATMPPYAHPPIINTYGLITVPKNVRRHCTTQALPLSHTRIRFWPPLGPSHATSSTQPPFLLFLFSLWAHVPLAHHGVTTLLPTGYGCGHSLCLTTPT